MGQVGSNTTCLSDIRKVNTYSGFGYFEYNTDDGGCKICKQDAYSINFMEDALKSASTIYEVDPKTTDWCTTKSKDIVYQKYTIGSYPYREVLTGDLK